MTLPPTMASVITSAMISAQRRFPAVARPYSGGEARPSFFLKNTAKPMSVAASGYVHEYEYYAPDVARFV